jgi:hypothetical protein
MLGLEWMWHHISSLALHSKAYTWLRSSIHALMQHGLMGGLAAQHFQFLL